MSTIKQMKYFAGIDEVGRGSVAGPIVAAAVVFAGGKKQKEILSRVKDSKKLTARKRQTLFLEITENFYWTICLLDNSFIDTHGIGQANCRLVSDLIKKLDKKFKNNLEIKSDYVAGASKLISKCYFYKHGEDKYPTIAAASIVAKVYRDKLMINFEKDYPNYSFAQHKGYGTKKHLESIYKFGSCPIHRRSFLKKYL